MKHGALTAFCALALVLVLAAPDGAAEPGRSQATQVVVLGTGTPVQIPDRSGSSVAVVVNDSPYLVDFGPGVVRRASAQTPQYGGSIKGLELSRLTRAFLTHLHSDHSAGLPDLILTCWVRGRNEPLELYGPEGVIDMAKHVLKAYDHDIKYRIYGLQPSSNNQGWRVNAHAVKEGVVYSDENVKVEAFPVRHGSWPDAYGYRFTTPDRVVVVSGDAAPDENMVKYSMNADVLVHEVYSAKGLKRLNGRWQAYHRSNHTSGVELGEIAQRARVKKLVLYHILFMGSTGEQIVEEVRRGFKGDVVLANDGDVF